MLGPLAFNGGTTRTHALLPGSPAINAGSNPLASRPISAAQGSCASSAAPRTWGRTSRVRPVPSTNFAYPSQFGSARQWPWAVHRPGRCCDRPDQPQHRGDRQSTQARSDLQFRRDLSESVRLGSARGDGQFAFRTARNRPDQPQHRRGRHRQQPRSDIQFRGRVSEPVRHLRRRRRPVQPSGRRRDRPDQPRKSWSTDGNNRRVQIFISAGEYLSQFGHSRVRRWAVQCAVRHCDRPDHPTTSSWPTSGTIAFRYSTPTGNYLGQFGTAGYRQRAVQRQPAVSRSIRRATTSS